MVEGRSRLVAAAWLAALGAMAVLPLQPAAARGIDCAKARTPLETAICGDPKLLELDATIAGLYARQLEAYGGAIAASVKRDQAAWLARLRTVGTAEGDGGCHVADLPCLREEMQARVDRLDSGTYPNGGVYRSDSGLKLLLTPQRANGFTLRLYDPQGLPEAMIATLDGPDAAMWDGPDFMVAKMGDGNGGALPQPKDGPESDGCALRLAPVALSIKVWQTGWCAGRDYAGTYRRDLTETLADYDTELH